MTVASCVHIMNYVASALATVSKIRNPSELVSAIEALCVVTDLRWFWLSCGGGTISAEHVDDDIYRLPENFASSSLEARDSVQRGIAALTTTSATSVIWSRAEIPSQKQADQRGWRGILERHGVRDGITVPVRIPGRRHVMLSFLTDQPDRDLAQVQLAVELVGPRLVDVARKLRPSDDFDANPTDITARQRQCLTLVAQGKSDWEAAQILGLSDQTVHAHIEVMRRRYGVRRRSQLIVRALYDGVLTYEDVLSPA